jgi:anti-anti-sigma factor
MAGLNEPGGATIEGSVDTNRTTFVSLGGELDIASVPSIEVELEAFIDAAPPRVVFDLSKVTFMDSSGIAMLLRAAERVASVEVRDPSLSVQLVLRATGLSEVLHVQP